MKKDKYKYLSKNIILFSISSFGQKILAFLLVPLYTNILSTAEYGTVDIVTTTVSLLLPIFTLNISESVMRFTIKDKECTDYLTYGCLVILKGSILLFGVVVAVSYLSIFNRYKNIFGWIYMIYIANSIYTVQQSYLRALNKVKIMITGSIINSAVMMLLNILLLLQFRLGINGYLLATFFGLTTASLFMEFSGKIYRNINYRGGTFRRVRKDCLTYCIPTIFTALAWWINSSLDKYFVMTLCGVDQAGIYSMAYKIPTLLGVFSTIFNQAWTLSSITEFDRNDSDGFFGQMYSLYSSAMVLICSWIIFLNVFLSGILYAKDFYEARHCVPILLMSSLFSALAGFFGGMFAAIRNTKVCAYLTIGSAVVNIILNFFLIPKYGIQGAAFATAIAYIFSWFMRIVISQKFIKMKIDYIQIFLTYILLSIQVFCAMTENHLYSTQAVIITVILLLNYRTYAIAIKQIIVFVKDR